MIYRAAKKTEGIKYAGSKRQILPYILDMLIPLEDVKDVLDGFSGTTRVSQAFAQLGYNTTANDISVWSEVFGTCYLKSKKTDAFYQEKIDYLNALKGYEGWFTVHYGTKNGKEKKPFQYKNACKLDAIRDEIEKLNLEWEDKCVLLTSLILALDKVDNTLGHFSSYLSDWSARSYNDLALILPRRFPIVGVNEVVRDDVFNTIAKRTFDLAYFDPPYGSNNEKMPSSRVRYAAYYHLWTTIILNDKPALFGVANRREDSRDSIAASVFEEFRKDGDEHYIAMKSLHRLISETNARYILLSYSSGGRATKQELDEILCASGKMLQAVEIDYMQNVMSQMRWTNQWINSDGKHIEYLFLIQK